MRVLHVVTDMRIANGVMSVVMNYASHMPEDVTFDVVYFKDFPENRKDDIEALGGKVYRLSRPGLKTFIKSDWNGFFKSHKGEYEAVHIHSPHLACMIIPIAKRYGIKKIAVHCHSTWYSLFPKNKFRNMLLSIPVKHMKVQRIGCGRDAGEFWYGKDNFKVLPNAVDCAKFRFDGKKRRDLREKAGYEDTFVVGHLGRVSPPQKNHPFLLRAFAEICKKRPDSVLLMIGADETDELSALAESLGIKDKIRFLGQQKNVPDLLCLMDVFVFPSLYEGLPVSVVEAQASGLPVVMSENVTDEVVCTDSTARLSLDKDPAVWADTAIELSALGVRDTYAQMVSSGWEISESAKVLEGFYRTGEWRKNGGT